MNKFGILVQLKLTSFLNAGRRMRRRSGIEFATLLIFMSAAACGLFFFFYQSFRFFSQQEPFGPILIDETLYLFNFSIFVMFLISSGVSAFASLFRSHEIPFLLTKPVEWHEIYFLKLLEAMWQSSWTFLFIAVPFMTAYGITKHAGSFFFPAACLAFYICFTFLTSTLGTLAAALTVWVLPSKKRRRVIFGLLLVGIASFFAHVQPQVIKEQGSIAGIMSGYLPHIDFAKNPFLPSTWVTKGIQAFGHFNQERSWALKETGFYFLLLLSNALFFIIPSYSAARGIFPAAFLKAQDHGESRAAKKIRSSRFLEKFFDFLPWPSRPALAYLEKDIKTFVRDPSEWSQLIIFFGLLLLYFTNLKNLHFDILKSFWKNLVFVLNTVGTYIVLSSFSMRFVFPMLSLEGRRSWIIGLAPMRFSSLLLVKFLLGTLLSVVLTMPLVFLSGWMLEISLKRVLFTTALGFFVCVALTGLSIGMGARFPNFKSNNPSEIISGFGGSMLLIFHLAYLAVVGAFLALTPQSQPLAFATMAAGSLLAGAIPLKMGINSLKKMEF